MEEIEQNLEMLEASHRNRNTQIRPYSRAGRRNQRFRHNGIVQPIPMSNLDEVD
jgi:hypothetical protein